MSDIAAQPLSPSPIQSTRNTPLSAEVGKFYAVPCMFVASEAWDVWMPRDGWLPILGPKHRDAEHLEFDHEHYHIDWRFIPESGYASEVERQMYRSGIASPHSAVLTNDTGRFSSEGDRLQGSPVIKRRKCRRAMPDFPAHPGKKNLGEKWKAMERAAFANCPKLKPGNICPHRGIDLTPFIKPDGTAVCPGHGLLWDTMTGNLLRHHTATPASFAGSSDRKALDDAAT